MLNLCEIDRDAPIGALVVSDEHGQTTWKDMVDERFAQFDYEQEFALIWHVAGRNSPVVIDPRVSFGAPTVRGIPTWILTGRWKAGESIGDMAEDFDIDEEDIWRGLKFEGVQAVA